MLLKVLYLFWIAKGKTTTGYLHGITSNIHSLSRVNNSICWQQLISLWLREVDTICSYLVLFLLLCGI